ncbi:glycerophosphodiester phosphodiesterase [Clostridium novyi A str. 4552]|uniref:Glycerophosphodiester phosphodiesterase n=1 Tax=Clostridium novyi A str. 4552 TaxID=1444289 RepID=A0A0A0I1E2_CLONO|nr:glycerophosphodiester phosphodiesterase [Clostridium novyi]KGM95204.1 glycerophosphodiester phosphodiesterase [Clostridium novyi A str. 4552]
MEHFINELKGMVNDFKYGWSEFFKYEIVTKLMLTILIIPIFSFFINVLMKNKGFSIISNKQILKFGMSKQGVLAIFIFYIMAVFVILIEIGGLIVIGNQILTKKKKYKFYSILGFCLKKSPKFIGIGGVYAVLFYLVFVNLIGIQPYSVFGIPLKLPGFIQSYIDESSWMFITEIIILVLILMLFIRWIFTFHFIILENKSAKKAQKESWKLIKGNFRIFINNFLIIAIFTGVIFLISYVTWMIILHQLMYRVNYNVYLGKVFIISVILIRKFLGILVFFILTPIQIHWITRLFYTLRDKENKKIINIDLKIKKKLSILDKLFLKKKTFIFILSVVLIILSLSIGLVIDSALDMMYNVKVTAHRGNIQRAPENTLSSVREAIKSKADFAEIDVVESKDGKIFLSHDINLKKNIGMDKEAWQLNYDDIKEYNNKFNPTRTFEDKKMPLLRDCMDLANGKIKLNIEIKASPHEKDIVKKVVDMIKEKDFEKECVVTSLDYETIQEVKKLNSKIKVGYIMFLAKGDIQKLNVDFYSMEESLVSPDVVYIAHSMGREVHVWTVNNINSMKNFIDMGVDNIITDESDELIYLLKELKSDSPHEKFFQMIAQ